ncbi:acyl-CoA dehydrogenase family protein, partial [Streptomyces pathocidini]|uniref:acyl-CoA dehydrogenase family protein n=1 Tax=Streptomyces pathocidini TaxID=1650571 RepID=UPI0034010889
PGVTARPADSALFASSGVGDVEFDGVRLGLEHLVGRTGMGLPAFARHIATERLAGALWGTALCRRALEDTHRHLTTRAHGDGTLWELDAVRQRFAACLVRVRELHALSRQLGDRVAYAYDTGAAATLKAAAGATVGHVLGECAQLWGAAGFTTGGIQETRAQAALFGIGGGATEVVLSAVADTAETILAELANDLADPGEDTPACGGALPEPAPTGPEQGTDVPRPGLGLPRPGGGQPPSGGGPSRPQRPGGGELADGLTCPGGGASVWGGAPLDVGEAGPEQGAEARQPGLGLPRPENGQPPPGGGQPPPPARPNRPHRRGAGR